MKDLSSKHGMVTDLFRLPETKEGWGAFRLTDGQMDFYRENGYVAGIRVLSDEQVDALCEELRRLPELNSEDRALLYEYHSNESSDRNTVLMHALGAWRVFPGFHDLLWNPAFTVPASQLLGGPVVFWHDQLFIKPPRCGGVVAWHQDYSYWTRTEPVAHITCWIGLDDADRSNGCLHYVPGSHLWDLLPITGLAGDMEAIYSVLNEDQRKQFKAVPIELKRGEAAFHHPLMVHGSFKNETDRFRRAAVINAVRQGVKSASDGPLLEGVPVIERGAELGGRFFPLLLDTKDLNPTR
jgi:ectoine hydroxylase-related dioxygenase (phytanoyl-CoA dioxygenase family)